VDEWQPAPLLDEPNALDGSTLDSIPVLYSSNGIKVKTSPNGKTVSMRITHVDRLLAMLRNWVFETDDSLLIWLLPTGLG
jgi:hypothetical protein